ncbi:SLBB domain-containing protein [bacterium]|nr:SLBB domain-containing protein [bacterium]
MTVPFMRRIRTSVGAFLLFAAMLCCVPQLQAQDLGVEQQDESSKAATPPERQYMLPAVEIPVSDTAYIVGPGDVLSINIFGTKYYNFSVPVNSDGTVIIPKLGTVFVRHSTLRKVRDKIHALLRAEVRKADIVISLSRARQVKVTVAGAVRKPGVVTLPATARVSEALSLAGGAVEDTTAMRNIVVQRIDGQKVMADLTRYLRTGALDANPFVSGGDRIYFPVRDRNVRVSGAVGAQGQLDFVPGERLYEALEVCQGLRASAFRDSVVIHRFRADNRTTDPIYLDLRGYPDDQSANIELHPGDLILVRRVPQYQQHRLVLVTGEVRYEGSYSIERGKTTLRDLIARAGGFTTEASLEEAVVIRKPPENEKDPEFERLQKIPAADLREDEYEYFKARSREKVGTMVVDFKRLFLQNDASQNIVMREGDVVEIPKQKNYIRIIGRADNPGNVIFRPGWSYMQYINAVGGFGWRADEGDVRVVKARTGELVDADDEEDYALEPGDIIWVKEVPETRFWETAFEALGVISQIAGILGIIIAVSR